ncbi:MAG TPA: peptidoglycan recognition family protein [Pyrinomonadaceae bacterium]
MRTKILASSLLISFVVALGVGALPHQAQDSKQPQFQTARVQLKLSAEEWEQVSNVHTNNDGLSVTAPSELGEVVLRAIPIPLESPEPSVGIAADWTAKIGGGVIVSIRVSKNGVTWGDWKTLNIDDDLRPSPGLFSSSFVYFEKDAKFAQARLQFPAADPERTTPAISSLQLTFFCSGIEKKTAHQIKLDTERLATQTEDAVVLKPSVVPREGWGCPDGQFAPRVEAQFVHKAPVTHLIVHHTDSDNGSTDWHEVIRGIWNRHTFPRSITNPRGEGWGDIGYNYLIDPNGVIYEGRAGGDNIVGFHFCGTNTGTMGVALLGTFTSDLPTAPALISLKNLLAWKASQSQINPLGVSYHASSNLPLANIAGHRDGICSTECPGGRMYDALSSIRNGVSNLVGPIPGDYIGYLDSANCNTISGWVADQNNLLSPVTIEILDGTTIIAQIPANQFRLDVAQHLKVMANFGFSIPTPIALKDGRSHSVRVRVVGSDYVLNGSGRTVICAPVAKYVGYIDVANCDRISGWAADSNRLNTSINVGIYADGQLVQTVLANGSRPDVGSVLGDNGMHGFSIPTPAHLKNNGAHSITAKFENSNTSLNNSRTLNCATTPNYIGFIDVTNCNKISGWVADKNRLNTSINVSIYADGQLIQTVLANSLRTDVGSFLGDNGMHGFSITTPANLKNNGAHSITGKFETSNTSLNNSNTLNCVLTPNYVGFLDVADCDRISGWAADRNRLNTAITVRIFADNQLLQTVTANGSRPDVGSYLGDNGLHGFSIATPSSLKNNGSHSITATFESSGSALGNSPKSLNCATSQPPTARFTMSGGGKSGSNGQTLNYVIPIGGNISFNFDGSNSSAGTGSITSSGWRISTTPVSSNQSFNYTLGRGSHLVDLTVRNSAGLTNTASATIVLSEVPRIDSISPSSPFQNGLDQDVTISGINFKPNLTVNITFPSGGSTTLSGTQIRNVSSNGTSFVMRATLSATGTWRIRAQNPDGGQSNTFSFTVR